MIYTNLVITDKGTFRLWDKDFMLSIDLSITDKNILYNILTKSQKSDLYNGITYKTVLSTKQIKILLNDPIFSNLFI